MEAGQQAQAQQQQVASLQQSLSHAQENTQIVQREKSNIAEQKVRFLGHDFPLCDISVTPPPMPTHHTHTSHTEPAGVRDVVSAATSVRAAGGAARRQCERGTTQGAGGTPLTGKGKEGGERWGG